MARRLVVPAAVEMVAVVVVVVPAVVPIVVVRVAAAEAVWCLAAVERRAASDAPAEPVRGRRPLSAANLYGGGSPAGVTMVERMLLCEGLVWLRADEVADFSEPSPLTVFPGLPGLRGLLTGTSCPPGNTVW